MMSEVGLGARLAALAAVAVLAVLLSRLVVRRMIALAVMDMPGARSAHERPTPRGGGAGAVAAVLAGTPFALALLPGARSEILPATLILLAMAILGFVSWRDDVRQFGYRAKLAAQLGCALLCVLAVAAAGLPPMPWPLAAATCLLSVGWIVFTTNAMNFIDGLNGLAAGSTALAALVVALFGWGFGDPLLIAMPLLLAAGLAGFLPFNFPDARIFLGDVGSQVCGLLLGTFTLMLWSDDGGGSALLIVPLLLGGIVWDVLFTLARRLRAGERITQAHRGHLYQVASRSFMSRRNVALLHWVFVLWGAALCAFVLPQRPVVACLLTLLPQLGWTLLVRHRARRAGLERWS